MIGIIKEGHGEMKVPSRIEYLIDRHIELQKDKLDVDREILTWLQDNAGVDLYNPSDEARQAIDSLNFSYGCERTREVLLQFIKECKAEKTA